MCSLVQQVYANSVGWWMTYTKEDVSVMIHCLSWLSTLDAKNNFA